MWLPEKRNRRYSIPVLRLEEASFFELAKISFKFFIQQFMEKPKETFLPNQYFCHCCDNSFPWVTCQSQEEAERYAAYHHPSHCYLKLSLLSHFTFVNKKSMLIVLCTEILKFLWSVIMGIPNSFSLHGRNVLHVVDLINTDLMILLLRIVSLYLFHMKHKGQSKMSYGLQILSIQSAVARDS